MTTSLLWPESWSAERIFFQRAIEHGDDNPNHQGRAVAAGRPHPGSGCGASGPRSVDSPLLQTLTAHDDELESLDCEGLLVAAARAIEWWSGRPF